MNMHDISDLVLCKTLKSISRYHIKVLAASEKETEGYSAEAEQLEMNKNIKILNRDQHEKIIEYITSSFKSLVL